MPTASPSARVPLTPQLEGAVSVLGVYCIQTRGNAPAVEKIVHATNGIEIPDSEIASGRIFSTPGGRAFLIIYGGERYAVLVPGNGSCAIEIPNEDLADVEREAGLAFDLGQVRVDGAGFDEVRYLPFGEKSALRGGHLFIARAGNPAPGEKSILLGVVPKEVANGETGLTDIKPVVRRSN